MRNFNKIRKMSGDGNSPSPYGYGQWANQTPSQFFGLQGNINMQGTDAAIPNENEPISIAGITSPVIFSPDEMKKREQKFKRERFLEKSGFNKIGNSIESGGVTYSALQNGMNVVNAQVNKDLVNGNGFNTMNGVFDMTSKYVGKVNPMAELAIKAAQTGINLINKGTSKETDSYSIDEQTQNAMGGSYSGSYQDMANAESKAGLEYGGFNRKAYKETQNQIAQAKQMDQTIQGINKDNQTRLAVAANVQQNSMNYNNVLNGGIDARYLRIGKLGIKLEILNRLQTYKTNQVININTKQIEEFKQGGTIEQFIPIITEPVDLFKDEWIPIITEPVELFREGGKTEELVKLEETNQKNVIPEGALHKNKHHIENTEGLTQKGIPVIDNDGEQQAEIELDEIIFTLEVTKKLEELHKIYKEGSNKERDEAATEAGKLLVQEILYNTDDRTGLIAKCEKGGKL